ncbi:DUF1566 domain-containing protein [Leptospira gomenensis]|uniref:DUF1566 domain-containing protein n=1 Tax=Leptospira gomenensis TaxID=2484974 RepID=A0A5F1YFP1_9LEPT|nr:DUF1566 domain-containing protein [Leptospira gomenensis]TGK39207.1 DUF1566 domain-containing protein [Leptospira gomenensis]TGK44252.1 DUF1566 domain-containing protein [Leptospira gomenensis]TGK45078.1 DUF1566 domain-containing protein [Leptospira gomenensis]TGK65114.1 DUF1566 domain-containing protein [Leptospira gomenensis]
MKSKPYKRRFLIFGILILLKFVLPVHALSGPFTDLGNGMIEDVGSGLIWQKCSRGQGTTVCSTPAASTSNWNTALSYCGSLGLNGRTWRLPSVKELTSIVDYGKTGGKYNPTVTVINPIINGVYFPDTAYAYYWTSTSGISTGTSPNVGHLYDPREYTGTDNNDIAYTIPINTKYRSMAYIVDFRMGGVIEFPKASSAYVRCVSGP